MKQNLKNAIPKSHFELSLDTIATNVGKFEDFVETMEMRVGTEPTYMEFAEELQKVRIIPYINTSLEAAALQANVMFHMYNTWQAKKPIYYVTPQLAIELAKTELNVDTEFLLSPYREIYVQIDSGLFSISDNHKEHPVKGFYVFFNRGESDVTEVRIMATSLAGIKDGWMDDVNFYFKLYLGPGKLKDNLKVYLDSVLSQTSNEELVRFGGATNVSHIEEFTYFVMNVLLYLTSKDPDILKQLPVNFNQEMAGMKSSGKIKKMLRKAEKATSCPVTIVGSNFQVNQAEWDAVRNAGGIGKWKLNHQVRVSAHWKTQWYGSVKENNRHSKNIRISSYTKGPDAAEVFQKKRVVV